MDHLETVAVARARSALNAIGREAPQDSERLLLLNWERLRRAEIVARHEKRETGEYNLIESATRLFGERAEAIQYARKAIERPVTKAAVGAGSSESGSWAAELYAPERLDTALGVAALRESVLGRLPNARRIPFYLPVGSIAESASLGWVAEGDNIPATATDADLLPALRRTKLAGLAVTSVELARASDIEGVLVRDSKLSLVRSMDAALLDPAVVASGDLPGSLTSVLTPISGTGALATPALLDAKLKASEAELIAASSDLFDSAWVMSPTLALAIATLRATGGAPAYPEINALGGQLLGRVVLTSRDSPAGQIALLDGGAVLYADDPAIENDRARETMIKQDSAGAGTFVSMFGTDSVAIRIIRRINWAWRKKLGSVITGLTA